MFRFLRKYNKWILAVGGTLLMIVFLIPTAFQQLSRAAAFSNAPRATIGPDGREVTLLDLDRVQQELQLMDRLGLVVPGLGRIDDPWHWYLLVREAEEAGLVGGPLGAALSPEQATLLQDRTGASFTSLETVFAKVNGVTRMLGLYQTAGQFSDRRLKAAAKRLFHTVRVQPLFIEASAEAVTYEPTDQELREQFERYAEFAPDDPEQRFGYRLPDRARLEWIAISREAVQAMIERSGLLSGTELRKHWRKNSGQGSVPIMPETPPAAVPDAVRLDLLTRLTDEKMGEIERFALNQLRSVTHGMPRADGYLVLPDDWERQRVDLRELAAALAGRYDIELPAYQSRGDRWLTLTELRELDGIGLATTLRFPPGGKYIDDLVRVAKEFQGSTTILVQKGVTAPPLNDVDGTLYLFRLLETDLSRPPNAVDEVREQVVTDLRRLHHFEQLSGQVDQFERLAEEQGLLALALDRDAIVQRLQSVSPYDPVQLSIHIATRQPLSPVPSNLPVVGAHEATVEALIDYALGLPQDVPVDELDEAQRVFVQAVDDHLCIAIFRLMGQQPLTEEQYQQRAEQGVIQQVLLNREQKTGESLQQAFSFQTLADRHGFELLATAQTQPDGGIDLPQ